MKEEIVRRAIVPLAVCFSIFALGFAEQGEAEPAPTPQTKTHRVVVLRLEFTGLTGGEGMMVALDSLAEAGKTAKFKDTVGLRLGAEVEIVPGFWFDGSVGAFDPALEITTHGAAGGTDVVQSTSVDLVPVLLGFEARPRAWRPNDWRSGRVIWGLGLHYGWVRYGSLPPELDAELQSTDSTWGFDARLDFRLGRKPWMLGVEIGFLKVDPDITDNGTGIVHSTRSDGFHWAVGVSRVF